MNLPRLTIRRLMITVAFLAILFWIGLIVSRWNVYRHRVMQYNEQTVMLIIDRAAIEQQLVVIPPENAPARKQLESAKAYNRQMLIKASILLDRYQKAVKRPWLRVEPDSTVEGTYYP
jgi:hypothetical protein